jgi:hypothetical protein
MLSGFHYVERDLAPFTLSCHPQQSAYGIGNPTTPANDTAHVIFGNTQFQCHTIAMTGLVYSNFIRMVYQGSSDIFY